MSDKSVLIIIPAYNEEGSIDHVIDSIRASVPYADILVVDDGCEDRTSVIAQKKGALVISLLGNLGIGGAVQTGYKFAFREGYKYAVQVDADGQHPAHQIEKLLQPLIENKADLVIGSRYVADTGYQSTLFRKLGISAFARLVSWSTGLGLTDTTSGFRACNRKTLAILKDHYPIDYPEAESIVVMHKHGLIIKEVSVVMNQRFAGKSFVNIHRAVYYMAKVALAILVDLLKDSDANPHHDKE